MNIIGLNDVAGAHHNSSAALIQNGKVVFASSEERYTRQKFDMSFPQNCIDAALKFSNLELSDIDYFAVGYPPSSFYLDLFDRKFFDMPRSVLGLVGHNFFGMMKYLFPNFKKMYKPAVYKNGLKELGIPDEKIIFMDHHQSHASSAYRCSGYDKCLTISMDGFGPNGKGKNIAGQIYMSSNGKMELLEEIPLYATALWYSAFTVCLGLKYMDGEGKTMGLAAYGDPSVCYDKIKDMVFSYKDGKWSGYPYWVDYIMVPRDDVLMKTRSGRRIMKLIEEHGQEHVAAAAQRLLEERILGYIEQLREKYDFSYVALAGGTFLNVKVNQLIRGLPFVKDIFVHPHASDGGTAVGAALELYHEKTGEPTVYAMADSNLGDEYSDDDIEKALNTFGDQIEWEKHNGTLSDYVANALTDGKVIGWFQGREEWGPRALGRRSVLADPRDPKTREKINSSMKNRDWFMPFAPSCMEDKGDLFFKDFCKTSFMTMAFDVVEGKESDVSSAIHVDNTARVHSVTPDNPLYYNVISKFYEKTGVPVILNTSFNKHGLPIVHRPKEAIEHLIWGCVHELAIGNFIVRLKNTNDQ
jgi:carbamoyltransferase